MSNPYYARYIPPSKSLAHPPLPNIDTIVEAKDREDGHTKSHSRKRAADYIEIKSTVRGKTEVESKKKSSGSQISKEILTLSSGQNGLDPVETSSPRSKGGRDGNDGQKGTEPSQRKKKKKEQRHTEVNEGEESKVKHASIMTKFSKSLQVSERLKQKELPSKDSEEDILMNEIEPLPQPKQPEGTHPSFSTLPEWLAKPLVVKSTTETTFQLLSLDEHILQQLQKQKYQLPSAVQAAVLPLLVPSMHQHPGDICISAATGSGKTLAYVLPIIKSLSGKQQTKLRALVIVPTRELVTQVRQTFQAFASKTAIRVGTATGSQSFKTEQKSLVETSSRFDPQENAKLIRRVTAQAWHQEGSDMEHDEAETEVDEIEHSSEVDDTYYDTILNLLPGHVPSYSSTCDILICTPGRLVDHIISTKGFSLNDIEWLIIDEADRLLDQSFQDWATLLIAELEKPRPRPGPTPFVDDPILSGYFSSRETRRVRKVVLSATMTRDLDKLQMLKLRNPKLVLVGAAELGDSSEGVAAQKPSGESFVLPATLSEYAVPVGDGLDKPLYLLRFLQSFIWGSDDPDAGPFRKKLMHPHTANADSQSGSDALSEESSDVSSAEPSSLDSSSDSDLSEAMRDSASDSDSTSNSDSDSDSDSTSASDSGSHSNSVAKLPITSSHSTPRSILIFTKSTESAIRLSHLLAILAPSCKSHLQLLTKSHETSSRPGLSRSKDPRRFTIMITTDRTSRGLDIAHITDILNYDVPRSVTTYVHRVGRTARAGRQGRAWTFFEDAEGWWFWNRIGRGTEIARGVGREEGDRGVKRVRVDLVSGIEERARYEAALAELGRDVLGRKGERA